MCAVDTRNLCRNCMNGMIVNGVCTSCGKRQLAETQRPGGALPLGYPLHRQYEIGRVLGSGGFGITYMAWDRKAERRVAVKELFPCKDVTRAGQNPQVKAVPGQEEYYGHLRQRFLEEARLLYEFRESPEIVSVFHLFSENNTAYYAMEYIDGMDLKRYLAGTGRLGWPQLAVYVKPVMRALAVLHSKNMIHRDISPDNIYLTRDGRVKLIDFGSVRCYSSHQGLTTLLKHNFAPLEQYREDGRQGPWTDIYALSVTIYYALAGVLPPKAPDRVLHDAVRPISGLCPDVPAHVARAIHKGMAVLPQNRFQNVREMAEALFPGENLLQRPQAQALAAGRAGQPQVSKRPGALLGRLEGIQGQYRGRQLEVPAGQTVHMGRDRNCRVPYPPNSPGISRLQCSLALDRQGRLCIRDENSTYGTYVNQIRLRAQTWYTLLPGNVISFAQEKFRVL